MNKRVMMIAAAALLLAVMAAPAQATKDYCGCYFECGDSQFSVTTRTSCDNCNVANFNSICGQYVQQDCGATPYTNYGTSCVDGKAVNLAIGAIIGIVIATLIVVIGIPICICFACGAACFSARRQRVVVIGGGPGYQTV